LAGMFLFGGKKKEEKKIDEKTERLRRAVQVVVMRHGKGLYRILARADPDGDEDRVKKILKHNPAVGNPDVTGEAWYRKKYAEYDTPVEREIIATHYPIIHAFLALALAHHTGVHSDLPGWTVEKVMSALYAQEKDYNTMKREYRQIAKALAYQAKKHGLTTDEEKTREIMEQALLKTFKIVDKLLPEVTEERLKIVGRALHEETDDPFVVLRNAGIDIEPELEEFRQFLAEISGKKTIPQEPHSRAKTAGELSSVASSLTLAARELLGLLSGLRLAGYSEDALENLRLELEKRIDGLIENPGENLELIGLYTAVLKLAEKGEIEKAEEFLRGL